MNKKFKLNKEEIKELTDIKGGCIASNKITINGEKIGYMYREKPSNSSDTGWRFFSGSESEEYTNNPDNFNIFELNTICNYDETIIPFLNENINKAFIKENNTFKEDR